MKGEADVEANNKRRDFLRASAAAGAALILSGCAGAGQSGRQSANQPPAKGAEDEKGDEVTVAEDLMREHGVLRRALLVYTAAVAKLRANASAVPPDALARTATRKRSGRSPTSKAASASPTFRSSPPLRRRKSRAPERVSSSRFKARESG
jgi:hypothetical protein